MFSKRGFWIFSFLVKCDHIKFFEIPSFKTQIFIFSPSKPNPTMKSRIADKISFSDKNTSKRRKILTKSIFFLQKSDNKGGNSKKLIFLKILDFLWGAFTPPLDTHLFMIKFPISYKINLYFWPETSKIIAILEMSTLKILLFYECS